ncbi:MAG: aldehyde ferredoxin oxidoreductase family protein [Candidatus Cloacimonetes bacterium]|nr:aldehyde ferredoxin oxidoreductase family protein [Candidatus Cloacimonadota bacterium]MBS3766549.1 aldehyde ferredoxin oxidoreductase family protein [Candidatus Cloacimonadota bacterium]
MAGWMNKILKINLSNNEQEEIELTDSTRENFLGGRGVGVKLFTDLSSPNIKPFDAENPLIFMTGPLTGTVLTSGRFQVISRSPLTNTICDSSSGGLFGMRLKEAGFDGLIFVGKAKNPVYVNITDDSVEIRDATNIWGKNTHETRDIIAQEVNPKASITCIGQAGENKVLFAALMNDKDRATGRGGLGAVMGSKNLKALVAYGTKKTSIAYPEELKNFKSFLNRLVKKNPVTGKLLPALGTSVLVDTINKHGMFPTKNFQKGVFNDAEGISGQKISENILKKQSACYKCPIACGRSTETDNKKGEGPEYETVWAFGAQLGISDLKAVTEANYICNEMGIDTISAGNTIGCAMELSEKGLFPDNIRWGDADRLVELVKKIGLRKGVGKELSLGAKRLAKKYGKPQLAMEVKGLELPAYDPRGAQGLALAYATSNRGGCHMRAYMIGPEILGQPVNLNRFSTAGKARIVSLFQDISAFVDSTILCRFLQFAIGIDNFAKIVNLVTGSNLTGDDAVKIGTRIYNLERKFNVEAGFKRDDDILPERFLNDKLKTGSSRNRVVELDKMLNEYYELRGWDNEGKPTAETLAKLNLS